ncbi:aldehyde dehydrogenase (NADP(+)) [Leptothrix sp. BB-4]
MNDITGALLVGAHDLVTDEARFQAVDPSTGERFGIGFAKATAAEVEQACALAEAAFDPYRETSAEARAVFLDRIAREIEAIGAALIDTAMRETGLPRARLEGERGRTCGQMRLFAQVLRQGHWMGLTLDSPLPARQPLPRSDLRQRQVPLGPVAVFGASNFPLAFSVAGGDTASALAAGCPVVVKGHSSHPGTSEHVGRAVRRAVQACGLPEGVFSLLNGSGQAIGQALVAHPVIQAVGFTGSRNGGLALLQVAQQRPQPIPVYAEMSSINPVVLLGAALADRAERIAAGFVDSLTLGTGQFCTNPGLVLGVAGPGWDRFVAGVATSLGAKPAGLMLNPGIHQAYQRGTAHLADQVNVRAMAEGQPAAADAPAAACLAQARVFETRAVDWLANPSLEDEVFGPCATLVRCDDLGQLQALLQRLGGQLTATLHLQPDDETDVAAARRLLPLLERKAGRILVNGFPTGVEVGQAMVHGGPYPATSDSRTTSVGARAIERFLRPVCYQDLPQALLPPALQDAALAGAPHRVDGVMRGG